MEYNYCSIQREKQKKKTEWPWGHIHFPDLATIVTTQLENFTEYLSTTKINY